MWCSPAGIAERPSGSCRSSTRQPACALSLNIRFKFLFYLYETSITLWLPLAANFKIQRWGYSIQLVLIHHIDGDYTGIMPVRQYSLWVLPKMTYGYSQSSFKNEISLISPLYGYIYGYALSVRFDSRSSQCLSPTNEHGHRCLSCALYELAYGYWQQPSSESEVMNDLSNKHGYLHVYSIACLYCAGSGYTCRQSSNWIQTDVDIPWGWYCPSNVASCSCFERCLISETLRVEGSAYIYAYRCHLRGGTVARQVKGVVLSTRARRSSSVLNARHNKRGAQHHLWWQI